ncbi:PREDICTED: uncharacterized protein LOC107073501 [Polistes dominula]|uniref:Uncharacterized protein LOC107073501 n=1 Tax=Polistes dominula TaxID=743375 RepID=A0ABM1JB38_POLDO|nr:PREDICTED: uncharacterized protein LOC107073501 [Polistes dominula]
MDEENRLNRDVLHGMLLITPLGGKQRQRMRWSDAIYKHLMLCYYKVTKLERDRTDYRTQLHKEFTNRYPELSFITEQRFADQVRTIIKNNRIPQPELDNIKQQVKETLEQPDTQTTQEQYDNTRNNRETHNQTNREPDPEVQERERTEQQQQKEVQTQHQSQTPTYAGTEEQYELTYIECKDTYIHITQFIKKPPNTPNTDTIIDHINKIIQNRIKDSTTMEELQLLIYTGSLTITKMHSKKRWTQTANTQKIITIPAWQHRLQKQNREVKERSRTTNTTHKQ